MKTKLKVPKEMSSLTQSAYLMKLKADVAGLKGIPKEEGPIMFIMRTNFNFEDGENTLFVAGVNNLWKKYAKDEAWLKSPNNKETILGLVKFEDEKMEVVVKKGKMTAANFKKGIKANKVLKRYEWNIVEAIDADEDDSLLDDSKQEETESNNVNEGDKAKAIGIAKELIQMLNQVKGIKEPKEKKALLRKIDTLADSLYVIPNWEDYTPDNLEAALAKIDDLFSKAENDDNEVDSEVEASLKEDAKDLQKILIESFGKIKSSKENNARSKEIDYFLNVVKALKSMDNWEKLTDDKVEKAIEQVEALALQLKQQNQIKQLKIELETSPEEFAQIEAYKAELPNFATIDAMEKYVLSLENNKPLSAAVNKFIQDTKNDIAQLREMEVYLNENLDLAEDLKKAIEESDSEEEQQALNELLLSIEDNIKAVLA